MANINLLPWREEFRQEKKKEFLVIVGTVFAVAAAISLGWSYMVSNQIEYQQGRNQHLEKAIAEMDKQVAEIKELKEKRQKMLDRMQVIQSLQGNRPDIVRILDEFARSVPDGVFFTSMLRAGKTLSLTGYAESNNRVSALMRALDNSSKFIDPNLTKVTADPVLGEQGSKFELRVSIESPDGIPETPDDGAAEVQVKGKGGA